MTLLERDLLPDWLVRAGIRRLAASRLHEVRADDPEAARAALMAHIDALDAGPIAVHTEEANAQHYEVPADFYRRVLGPSLKYSAAHWSPETITLGQAEDAMLRLQTERAEIAPGQRVLDLGCGWGSMLLQMAERFPASEFVGVSNSRTQRLHIEELARVRGLANVQVLTADMNGFAPEGHFDRVVSIEMFEHMRNWRALLGRIARWLRPDGKLFVHLFAHRRAAYFYEDRGPSDWMARHFFTGGQMPSEDLLLHFQDGLRIERQWSHSGRHYAKTANAWLERMDRHRREILALFAKTYGESEALRHWSHWRLFFLACAETFGYRGGREWVVAHYRLARR